MIADLLCDLAACLCAELTPDGAVEPDVCFCGVVPGAQFAHDYSWTCDDKCGAAWVRVAAAYPAVGTGVPLEGQRGCNTLLGIDVELGVIRCLEQEERGEPPSQEQMHQAAVRQIGDMVAVRRAVSCCAALDSVDYVLGNYQPIGPGGMVVGGTWGLSLAV